MEAISGQKESPVLHSCAPRRQVKIEKNWQSGPQSYMHMQGKCWEMSLNKSPKRGENYLQSSKRFGGWNSCSYGTLYSALGMSIDAVGFPAENDVIFGAPGTFDWTGTIAAKRFVFSESFSVYIKIFQ